MGDYSHIKRLIDNLLDSSISEKELSELLRYMDQPLNEPTIKALLDDHWEEIKSKIGKGPRSKADLHFSNVLHQIEKRQHIRTRKSQIERIHKPTWKLVTGIAAAVLVLISVGLFWSVKKDNIMPVINSESVASGYFTGKQFVHLPDGSKVVLNEGSQLQYDDSFGKDNREVIFSGEGYFDVVHDPSRPFIVRTGVIKTTVLGTAFNVTAFGTDADIFVTVARGKVSVGNDEREYDKILPEQQLKINKKTQKYEKDSVVLDEVLAWKNTFLILDDVTIEKAAEMIGQKFRTRIILANEQIKNCEINAAFMKGESLEQVLRVVCGLLQADYTLGEDRVTIKGGRKCE